MSQDSTDLKQEEPKGVIAWFIANPVAANLLMIAIIILGYLSLQGIRTEFMPKAESRVVSISASLPGGSPAEIEEAITLKLENIVRQVPGVKKTSASSTDSSARVVVIVEDDFDVDKVMRDIKNNVDSISGLPKDIERLVIKKVYGTELAIQLTLYGQIGELKAKLLLEDIRRELLTTTNVRSVFPWGVRPYQINIEIEEEKLQQYGLILNDVARRVRAESVNLPGGVLKSRNGYIAIRAEGQAYDRTDYENIVLLSSEDGRTVYLRDVAKITDGFVDWKSHAFFDDQFAVGLSVSALGQQDAVAVANEVKAYVKRKQKDLPPGVH
ncbi:MAG: efflux RND transporter permease subunit, partial [Sinobacterium sp.]|nr:efflux RND transporter permease subunit [Sinobacterium sp.]